MTFVTIVWDLEDDPDGNVQHIAQHGVSREEVEELLNDDPRMIYPVTAYDAPEPR